MSNGHSRYREEPTIDMETAYKRLSAAGYAVSMMGNTMLAQKGEAYLGFSRRLNRQHLTCYSEQAIDTAARQ